MDTPMKVIDVGGAEFWREYVFPCGAVYRVSDPQTVHISASGSHRVVDKNRIAHHVSGWIAIRWDGAVIA